MSDDPRIHVLPYDEDPLVRLAELVVDHHRHQLPDLSHAVVLLPNPGNWQRFRECLLAKTRTLGFEALIPPALYSMPSWVLGHLPPEQQVITEHQRETLLLDALSDQAGLKKRYGTWPLIDSLLTLFDELTLNTSVLPSSLDDFRGHLEKAYGVETLAPLGDEAQLVHSLWHAWHARMAEINAVDPATAYIEALAYTAGAPEQKKRLYLAGFLHFSRPELDWLKRLRQADRLDLVLSADASDEMDDPNAPVTQILSALDVNADKPLPQNEYSLFLNRVFSDPRHSLVERTMEQRLQTTDSPAIPRLEVAAANHPEEEARCVDLQVRQWLAADYRHIGVITNDRKLARRVRALLERANVALHDSAGWTLSTTSAASSIIGWLNCIEQQFRYDSLLDLLKSPFLLTLVKTHDAIDGLAHFERQVIQNHKALMHLARFRQILQDSKAAFDRQAGMGAADNLICLLDTIEKAAAPLTALHKTGEHKAGEFFYRLHASLDALGLLRTLAEDKAGREIAAEITEIKRSTARNAPCISWEVFRSWLTRCFERRKFSPDASGQGVELMGFEQGRLSGFDGVIIAGASRKHLPGPINESPFFNDAVRRQLDLPSRFHESRLRFAGFRRLLESAPQVLITVSLEDDGKPVIPSPWLERLQAFHLLAYGTNLEASKLLTRVRHPATRITQDISPLPDPVQAPQTCVDPQLIPDTISASAYQHLVDCPYRFFAQACLKLRAVDDVTEDMEKTDYGLYVHRILRAFHGGLSGLPGPFDKALTRSSRTLAEKLMHDISTAVFSKEKNSLLAKGWYLRWRHAIPLYLDWQIIRQQSWNIKATEIELKNKISADPDLSLKGRLDRLDQQDEAISIIDYKTGRSPKKQQILHGESVQLPCYALLVNDRVTEVAALEINDAEVVMRAQISETELEKLLPAHRQRLQDLFRQLHNGATVYAWGDEAACQHCPMGGLCRHGAWVKNHTGNAA